MNAIHKERLLKLADFLDTIPKDKFDFGHVVNKCHTVGCAMGWCPVVFPDLVKYLETEPLFPPTPNEEHYHDVQTIDEECQSYDEVAAEIFGLPSEVGLFLFTANFQEDLFPGEEESEKATKMNRGNNASASEVAEMLRQFLRYVEDGTINLDDF